MQLSVSYTAIKSLQGVGSGRRISPPGAKKSSDSKKTFSTNLDEISTSPTPASQQPLPQPRPRLPHPQQHLTCPLLPTFTKSSCVQVSPLTCSHLLALLLSRSSFPAPSQETDGVSWPLPTSFLICWPDTCFLPSLLRKKSTFSADPDSVPLMVNKKLDFAPRD